MYRAVENISQISSKLLISFQRSFELLIMSEAVASPDSEIDKMTKDVELVELDGEFSLVLLAEMFKRCQTSDEVKLEDYLAGYKELYKFLCLMGTVFGWVGSDVYNKVVLLEKYLVGDKKEHYQTVKSMIDYEVRENNNNNCSHFLPYISPD